MGLQYGSLPAGITHEVMQNHERGALAPRFIHLVLSSESGVR